MRGPGNKAWLFWLTAFLLLPAPWLVQDTVRHAVASQFALWLGLPPPEPMAVPGAAGRAAADALEAGAGKVTGCQVLKVHDADTADLLCGLTKYTVRLHCIDAPELDQLPFGIAARDGLRALIMNRVVDLEPLGKDRYGRTVGVLWAGGENINLIQVREGRAVMYPKYCREDQYRDAEREAKAASVGVWAKPGLHQTPWEWRASKR